MARRHRARRGRGTIDQRPSGMWRLRVPYQGRRVPYGEFATEGLAERAQARWIETGRLPEDDPDTPAFIVENIPPPEHDPDEPRCSELFERWQQARLDRAQVTTTGKRSHIRKQTRKRGGSKNTENRDRSRFRWWQPVIADMLPSALTEKVFEDRFKLMEAALAPNTIRTNLAMMKAFLNWMVEEGYLAENPIATWVTDVDPVEDRVRPVVVPDFTFIGILSDVFGTHDFRNRSSRNSSGYVGVSWQQSTKRWIAYDKKKYLGLFKTAEEADGAVRAAKGLAGETTDRLVFELLLGTAGRRSEVAGFRMMDVDLTAKRCWAREPVVLINGKPVRQPVPKGGKARSMRIGPDLARMVQVERARRGVTDPLAPLVTGPRGALLNFDNWIDDRLVPALEVAIARWAPLEAERLMKEDGLTRAQAKERVAEESEKLLGLRPHHLRHTAVALMIAAGASDAEIQQTLGHSDIETTRRIYMHVLESQQNSTAAKVEQLRRQRAFLTEVDACRTNAS